jgi:hypothetical protein
MNSVGHGVSWGYSGDFHLALASSWEYTPSHVPLHGASLEIADCRLLMDIGRSCHTTFSIINHQSSISNRQSARRGGCLPSTAGMGPCQATHRPLGGEGGGCTHILTQDEITRSFSITFPLLTRISFVFIYIPASPRFQKVKCFVFYHIPAYFRHF